MAEEPQEQAQEQQPRKKEPLWGFIASDPELTFTQHGDARFYARIGEPQSQREIDGTFTDLDPEFGDLVMFRKSAERAYAKFQKGDNFLAVVEKREYTGKDGQPREQYEASRIGHDNNTTNYTVDRTRRRDTPHRDAPEREPAQREASERGSAEHDAAGREAADRDPVAVQQEQQRVQQALAEREAALDPDTPASQSVSPVQREAVAR